MLDTQKSSKRSDFLAAAFLMSITAIGPGFLTQSSTFAQTYGADFGFIILISLVLAMGVQINVWRVLCVSNMRGQDVANKLLPGLGYVVAFLVALGGLAFNIGNIGGTAMGINAMFGMNMQFAYIVSGVLAILVFLSKNARKAIDNVMKILGAIMIVSVLIVMFITKPNFSNALVHTVMPQSKLTDMFFPIITLLGGTVGGYITFAGAHRLIDSGTTGKENAKQITSSSLMGISIAALMRVLLFLATLGVVESGQVLDPANPSSTMFLASFGPAGLKFFGVVLFAASITSVVGCAYTSVSFIKTLSPVVMKHEKYFIIGFIAVSTLVMSILGSPAKLLILVGALNGLILPIVLTVVLLASRRKDIVGEYHHPTWMIVLGAVIVLISSTMGVNTLIKAISTLAGA